MRTQTLIPFYWITVFFLGAMYCSNAQSTFTPCWAIGLDGNDPEWPGYENLNISKAARLSDGFVIAGTYYQHIFPSKDNKGLGRTPDGGIYIAKYDFNGNLQWLDYGVDSNYTQLTKKVNISSITTDDHDNIYICGMFHKGIPFWYDNGSTHTKIAGEDPSDPMYSIGYFIAKLNKNGQVLWHTHTDTEPLHITYAPNGKLIVAGEYGSYYEQAGDTSRIKYASYRGWQQCLLWIDTLAGQLYKVSTINQNGPNYRKLTAITADQESNVIAVGMFESDITFYAPGNTDSLNMSVPKGVPYSHKFYAVKYDSSGKPLWRVSDANYLYGGSEPTAIDIDRYGNIYVVSNGQLRSYLPDSAFFFNADSSFVTIKKSPVHLYKITKDGFLDWYTGGGMTRGCGLSVSDTGVFVAGFSYYTGISLASYDTFYSATNDTSIRLLNEDPNIAIAQYNSSGTIQNATRIGTSNGKSRYTYIHTLPADQGGLILYGQYSPQQDVTFYNDTLHPNGMDGFILKYTPKICDSLYNAPVPPRITFKEPFTDTVLCGGSRIVVHVDIGGNFFSGNIFGVQLSDANGDFSRSQVIASLTADFIDSIICTIPTGVPSGSGYRLRLNTTNPYNITSQNLRDIRIIQPRIPGVKISSDPGGNILPGTPVTFTAKPVNGGTTPLYQWKLNDVPIAGASNNTYATNTLQSKDVVSVVLHSSEQCVIPDSAVGVSNITIDSNATGVIYDITQTPLTLYPNPNTGVFTVSGHMDGIINIELMNSLGQIVYKETLKVQNNLLNHTIRIGPGNTSGSYMLRLITENDLKTIRFSVIR